MPGGKLCSDWPFTIYSKTPRYRTRLSWVRPDHNSNGGEDIFSIGIIRLEILDYLSKRFRLFRKFPVRPSQTCQTIYILSEIDGMFGYLVTSLSSGYKRCCTHSAFSCAVLVPPVVLGCFNMDSIIQMGCCFCFSVLILYLFYQSC